MRIRDKFLAFALAILMVAGLLPFSIFALDADNGTTTQTREEYVAANGGTMLFGTSFDDSSKISGDRVSSSTAGTGSLSRASASGGDTRVWVDVSAGALRLVSGEQPQDFWPYLSFSAERGDNIVLELSFRFDKQLPSEDNLMYSIHDFKNSAGSNIQIRPRLVGITPLENDVNGREMIGLKLGNCTETFYEFAVGETVNLAVVIEPTTRRIHGYIDGEYIDTGVLASGFGNLNNDEVGYHPSFNGIRMFQITGDKNQDISVFDLYAYSNVEYPYAAAAKHSHDVGYFAEKNGAKMLSYYDFEDITHAAIYYTKDGKTVDYTGDRTRFEDQTHSNTGTGYNFRTPDGTSCLIVAPKFYSDMLINNEDGNDYLRMTSAAPMVNDSYFDTYQRSTQTLRHETDEVIVIQRSFRRSPGGNTTYNLMNFRNRGNDANDIPAKFDFGTGMLKMEANGDVKITNGAAADNGKVIGQIKTDEFTDITVILDVANNKFAVAIDGVVVSKDQTLFSDETIANIQKAAPNWTTGMYCPTEIRTHIANGNGSNPSWRTGYLDVDNLYVYCGGSLSVTNFYGYSDAAHKNEWVKTDAGYWRYYDENGRMAIGTKEIGGRTYYFDGDGYFSTLERETLVDFNSVNANMGMNFSGQLSATDDIKTSGWKYSALWGDFFHEGYIGDTNNVYKLGSSTNVAFKLEAQNAAVNPEFIREISEAEANALSYNTDLTLSGAKIEPGTKVFDLAGYQGIEFDWYVDKSVDMRTQMLAFTLQREKRSNENYVRDAYYKYGNAIDTVAGETRVGWNTTIFDLTRGNDLNLMIGGSKVSGSSDWNWNYVKSFQLDLTWDNINKDNYLNGVKVYIGAINVVRYSPVKSDVRPDALQSVRLVDGKIVVYGDNMSEPATGWTTVGEEEYYCLPDGTAVTGPYEIAGNIYLFDDNGKLVGNADGIYEIDGKYYYYKNGTRQMGEFTGIMYNGRSYSFNTKGNGEIVSLKYIVPGYVPGAYTKPDYSKVSADDLLVDASFDYLPTETTGEGSNIVPNYAGAVFGNLDNVRLQNQDTTTKGDLLGVIKRTRFYYVDEGNGDVALKMYNENRATDPFMDLNIYNAQNYENVVFEASFRLGTDWNTKANLVEVQDRLNGKHVYGGTVSINEEGYLYIGDVILGRLSTDTYTRVSVVHIDGEGDYGTLHIYINGVKTYVHSVTASDFDKPSKYRVMHYTTGDGVEHGTMYINDVYAYIGTEPIEVDTTSEVRNGVYKDGDVTRIFKDGYILTKDQMIEEGKHAYFDPDNGAMFDGSGFIEGKYYENGIRQSYTGLKEIDGVKYYFDETNTIVTNKKNFVDLDNPNKAYNIDENGVVTEELYKGNVIKVNGTELGNAESDVGEVNSGTFVYDKELGQMVYKSSDGFRKETNLFTFDTPVDLSQYGSLEIKIYNSEYYKTNGVTFGIFFGRDVEFFKIEGYSEANNTYTSIASESSPEMIEKYAASGLRDTGKYAGGLKVYQDKETGVFYGRKWEYTGMPNKASYKAVYNLKDYDQGWVTVSIPLSNYDQNFLKSVNCVRLIATGWTFGTLNAGIDLSQELRIADAAFVTYVPIDETKDGWIDGRYYIGGEMQFGWFNYEGFMYYLDPVTGLKVTGVAYVTTPEASDTEKMYCDFGSVGAYQGPADGIYDTASVYYNSETEKFESISATRIFADGEIVTGLQNVNGKTYYADPETFEVLKNTVIMADTDGDGQSEMLYLGEDGSVSQLFGGWVEDENGNRYYSDEAGNYASGYALIDGYYYYFDPENGNAMVTDEWVTIYGVRMYFGNDGKAPTGIMTITGAGSVEDLMYFIDGVPTSTEFIKDGYIYKFDKDGLCTEKTLLPDDSVTLLIWVVKDGIKTPFYFEVSVGGSFTKKFESFNCYSMVILDENGEEIEFEDYTLALEDILRSATYTVKYKALAHEYNEGIVSVEPGCGTEGEMKYVCKNCGSYYTEPIPATGEHEYGEWEVIAYGTCTFNGVERRTCIHCGAKETRDTPIDPNNHKVTMWEWLEEPTCTSEGVRAGLCIYCGEKYVHETVPKLEHIFTDWEVDRAPTCIEKGREVSYCDNGCGTARYRDIAIDPDAHNEDKLVLFQTIKAPTCSQTGIGTYRCTDCGGFVYDRIIPVDPDAHVWDEGEILNPDMNCGYDVEKIYHCTEPGCTATKTEIIPAGTLGSHEIDFDVLHYTTDENDPLFGYHYYICSKCQKAFEISAHVMDNIEKYDANGHMVSCDCGYSYYEECEHILVEGDDSSHWYECKCGDIIGTEAHNFVSKYDGEYHWEECEVCGKIINKHAHEIEHFDRVDSTCTAVGHEAYDKCKYCEYYQTPYVEIPMKEHEITEVFGYDENTHWYKCANCDFKHLIQEHSWIHVDAVEATCTERGWNAHTECAICGYSPDVVYTGPLGHDVDGQVIHFDEDTHWQICLRCHERVIEEHTYPTDPSMYIDYDDEEGTARVKCLGCDYEKALDGLPTWWGILGLERQGDSLENYKYTYTVNGELVKDALVLMNDGSYRYFDDNGYLVRAVFENDSTFDKLVGFIDGDDIIDGLTAKDGERGAIKNAIINTSEGIFMVENGVLMTGWITLANGNSYFFYSEAFYGDDNPYTAKKEGVLLTPDDPAASNLTIMALDRKNEKIVICNVAADGAHLIGVVDNGDGTHSLYLDGTAGKHMNGIIEDVGYTNKVYYAVNGILQKGTVLVEDVYYIFNDDYVLNRMCRNEIIDFNGVKVYVNDFGQKAANEWVNIGGSRYYITADNAPTVGKFNLIGDAYYDFDSEGKLLGFSNGLLENEDGTVSYIENGLKQVSKFFTIDGKLYYFDVNGNKLVGTEEKSIYYIGDKVFSFDEDGAATEMEEATWVYFLTGGKGYYDGTKLTTGLNELEDGLYYFDEQGVMAVNKTITIDDIVYYFGEDGKGKVVSDE